MKRFERRDGFLAELAIFDLIERVAPNCAFVPHAIKHDESHRVMLIRPFVRQSWADVDVTVPLTWRVLHAACTVLPFFHANGIVHGDISPYNILMDDADGTVVINDFSGSFAIGTVLDRVCGTIDYASDALGVLLQDEAAVTYTYLPLDDHKALFLTVLSRYWLSPSSARSHKPHLPWSNEITIRAAALSKYQCLANAEELIFTVQQRVHMGEAVVAFMLRWFELLFRDESARVSCDRIVAHLQTFSEAVGAAAVADDGACRLPLSFLNAAFVRSLASIIILHFLVINAFCSDSCMLLY